VIVSDSFVIADWSDPGTDPGRPIAGLHLHRSDDEAWIVLEGRLGFRPGARLGAHRLTAAVSDARAGSSAVRTPRQGAPAARPAVAIGVAEEHERAPVERLDLVAELSIEAFYPANAQTAARLLEDIGAAPGVDQG
jgi:hypothetical protein